MSATITDLQVNVPVTLQDVNALASATVPGSQTVEIPVTIDGEMIPEPMIRADVGFGPNPRMLPTLSTSASA